MHVHTETHIMKWESLCTYYLKIAVWLLIIFNLNVLQMPPFQQWPNNCAIAKLHKCAIYY